MAPPLPFVQAIGSQPDVVPGEVRLLQEAFPVAEVRLREDVPREGPYLVAHQGVSEGIGLAPFDYEGKGVRQIDGADQTGWLWRSLPQIGIVHHRPAEHHVRRGERRTVVPGNVGMESVDRLHGSVGTDHPGPILLSGQGRRQHGTKIAPVVVSGEPLAQGKPEIAGRFVGRRVAETRRQELRLVLDSDHEALWPPWEAWLVRRFADRRRPGASAGR